MPNFLTISIGRGSPNVDPMAWVAPGAVLAGNVTLASEVSVWYNAVVRADSESVTIGARTNLQDGVVVHADPGLPVIIGRGVSVGHRAVLHGCSVGDDVLVGMGALVLNGAAVGSGSLIAAGTVVLEGADVPPRSLVAGVPGRVRRALTDDELESIQRNAADYCALARLHGTGTACGVPELGDRS